MADLIQTLYTFVLVIGASIGVFAFLVLGMMVKYEITMWLYRKQNKSKIETPFSKEL